MITNDQRDKINFMFNAIKRDWKKLNSWEMGYCSDIEVKLKKYGQNINLTTKQINAIEKIYEKVTDVTGNSWFVGDEE